MFKKYFLIVILCMAGYSSASMASTYCWGYDVQSVKVSGEGIYAEIYISSTPAVFKLLGMHGDDRAKLFQSIALQALSNGKKIVIRYVEDGIDCGLLDESTLPDSVRILK